MVVAWPRQEALATALADAADQPITWLGLGRRDLGPLRLIVAPDSVEFREFTRGRLPGWSAGAAFPRGRTVVLRADGGDILGTLRHELAHLALHDAVPQRVPLWFDEGYATVASGQWGFLDRLSLNLAVARGDTPGLPELDAYLRGSSVSADAAYALAATAVLELGRRNPTGTLDPLFQRLEAGTSFDEAVFVTTGLTLDRFDEAWRRGVRLRFGLVTWMVGTGIWLVLAAGVVLLHLARRRRDRPRRAALDDGWTIVPDEEGPNPLDDQRPPG